MMESVYLDTTTYPSPSNEVSSSSFSIPARSSDSFIGSYIRSGAECVRETIADIGAYHGINQLDNEIEARLTNLHTDATKAVSWSFKWATKGLPKLMKKSASVADYYLFSRYITFVFSNI